MSRHSPSPPGHWTALRPPARSLASSALHAPSAPADPPFGSGRRLERSRDHRHGRSDARAVTESSACPASVVRAARRETAVCGDGAVGESPDGRAARTVARARGHTTRRGGARAGRVPGRGGAAPARGCRGGRAGRRRPRPAAGPLPPVGGAALGACGDVVAPGEPALPAQRHRRGLRPGRPGSTGAVSAARAPSTRSAAGVDAQVLTAMVAIDRLDPDAQVAGAQEDLVIDGSRAAGRRAAPTRSDSC